MLSLKRSIVLDLIGEPEISSNTSFSLRTVNTVMGEFAWGSGKRVWLVVTLGWEDRDGWIFATLSLKNAKVVSKVRGRIMGGKDGVGVAVKEFVRNSKQH